MNSFIVFLVAVFMAAYLVKTQTKETAMNNSQTQQAKAPKPLNTMMNTIHDVVIVNTQLIGEKLLGILAYITGLEDDIGVYTIIFSDKYPVNKEGDPVLARFYADARTIVINLQAHLKMAVYKMEHGGRLHFWHYLWLQIIRTLYHEIHHANRYADADHILDVDTDDPKWESDAEEHATDMVIELAKTIDIEPPTPQDFPFFTKEVTRLAQYIVDTKNPNDWQETQGYAIVSNLAYFEPGIDGKVKPREIETLREYIRDMVAQDGDPRWAKPVGSMADIAETVKAVEPEPGMVLTGKHNGEVVTATVPEPEPELVMEIVPDSTVTQQEEVVTFPDSGPDDDGNGNVAISRPDLAVEDEIESLQDMPEPDDTFWADDPGMVPDEGAPDEPFDDVYMDDDDLDDKVDYIMTEARANLASNTAEKVGHIGAPVVVNIQPTNPQPLMMDDGDSGEIDLGLNQVTTVVDTKPKPAMRQLEPHNIPVEQCKAISKAVLLRLYAHLFQKCGWNGAGGFTNLRGVLEPVYIGDIPGANQLFHSYEVIENKTMAEKRIVDTIQGHIMPKAGIPGYHLYLNIGGMKYKRAFLPQNSNKTKPNSSELTAWAARAKTGEMIAMLTEEGKGVRISIITPVGGKTEYKNPAFEA